jgi:hypothetical protein
VTAPSWSAGGERRLGAFQVPSRGIRLTANGYAEVATRSDIGTAPTIMAQVAADMLATA